MHTSPCDNFYGIAGMWRGKEASTNDLVSKIIYYLNRRQILYKFNQNQIRDIFRVFDMRE